MKKIIAMLLAITLIPCGTAWANDAETLTIPADGVLTIALPGTYRVTGEAAEGRIVITAPKKSEVTLILDGVSLTCTDGAALETENSIDLIIELAAGTENRLVSGSAADDAPEGEGAAVKVKGDLTITGEGALFVGGYLHNGVQASGTVKVKGGCVTVEAAHTGLRGKEGVRIKDGVLTLTTGGDGLSASDEEKGSVTVSGGTLTIVSQGDAVQAQTDLIVEGGTLDLTTGAGSASVQHTGGDWDQWGRGGKGGFDRGGRMYGPGGHGGWNGDRTPPANDMQTPGGMTPPSPDGAPMPVPADEAAADNTDESVSRKGLKSAGTLTVSGGTIAIDSEDDALHADCVTITGGTLTLASGDDGIHADTALSIAEGTVVISRSYEGLEGVTIEISGGDVRVTASDDGINASDGSGEAGFGGRGPWGMAATDAAGEQPLLRITGGSLYVNAEGDGLDSNGSLLVEGGLVIVDGPTGSGNGALDAGTESGGACLVHGGTVLAIGAAGMAESFDSASVQSYVSANVNIPAGAEIVITAADGTELTRHTTAKTGSNLVFSCPGIADGDLLTVTVNGAPTQVTAGHEPGSSFGFGGRGGFGRW